MTFFTYINMFAQESKTCNYDISGKVFDEHDKEPLLYAEIYIKELNVGAISDSAGNYKIENVCAGNYSLICMHIGCEPVEKKISVTKNLKVNFVLEHHTEELSDIEINAKRLEEELSQQKTSLNEIQRDISSGKNLGDALKEISGVTTLNTGNTIAKPIIHGLYGNRILTINNGVRQEDQQWANEHAPNIDPFAIDKISVVKGAAAVQYGSDALGGVILLEQQEPNAKIEGSIYTIGNSNGKGGILSTTLKGFAGKKNQWIYKVNGTIKRSGDLNSPEYNLSNTGVAERNITSYLQYKTWKQGLTLQYSLFNTDIGILRATHIGNTTDLTNAINSSEPYYIKDFSYNIESPRQNILHQVLKAEYFQRLKKGGKITLQYAAQINSRKEFDVRRGGRSSIPALDLNLQTHTADFVFQNTTPKKLHNKVGLNAFYQNNYNIPGTGFRPVLPNYDAYSVGVFLLERYKKNKLEFETGVRYDYKFINAQVNSRNNEISNETFSFHNIAFSLGGIFNINKNITLRSNIGSAFRPPNVYELLSDGVHQSAASIEVGDINLNSEQSLKWITTLSAKTFKNKVQIELSPYVNTIRNYILLQPEQQARLTIRGAFPVFSYKQTNALISGLDFDLKYDVIKSIAFAHRTSFLYGRDLSAKDDLIFMPPVQFNNTITFQTGAINKFENLYLTFNYVSVLTQYWYPEGIDFTLPPRGYNLFNVYTGINLPFNNQQLSLIFQIENVFNVAYRDYLNRFRYFADNMGRNFSIKIKYHFLHKPKNKLL